MKKRFLITVAFAITSLASSAIADDLKAIKQTVTTPQRSTWTGVYLGLNAGGTFGQTSFDATPGLNWWGDPDSPGVFSALKRNTAMGGATFGGQVGYNYQFSNNVVVGFEADGEWFGATGNYASGPFPGLYNGFYGANGNFSGNWLATARGRLGYAITPDVLIYGTGGLAVADYSYSHQAYFYNDPTSTPGNSILRSDSVVQQGAFVPKNIFVGPLPPPPSPTPNPSNPDPTNLTDWVASSNITPTAADQVACLNPGNRPNGNCRGDGNGTGLGRLPFTKALAGINAVRQTLAKAGWTVGGGVEWKFAENLSLKAEYLYTKFGNQTANSYYVVPYGNLPVFQMQHRVGISSNSILRAGVNYHLNWYGKPSVAGL